jgi:putative ABC transport system permease protein
MRDWRAVLAARLAGLDLPPAREAEVLDELAQHMTDREADLLRAGHDADAAHRLALDELDDHAIFQRELQRAERARRPTTTLTPPPATSSWRAAHLWQDLRYAARTLGRDRGFSVTALLALALGIGGAVAIFAAVDAVLLRPMPFPHADRLVVPVSVNVDDGSDGGSVSFADYADWRQERDLFAEVALWRPINVDLTGHGDPERILAAQVSAEYFPLIDVRPVAGRTLVPADHEAGAARVGVISYGLWQRRFGAASDAVGSTIMISGLPTQVVGVLPARAVWPDTSDLFLPLRPALLNEDVRTRRDNLIFNSFARLADGVPIDRASARVAEMSVALARREPIRAKWTNRLVPLREFIVEKDVRLALFVLLGAVGSVLLIVCANVANLALVRGQARTRELAIRLALGASRARVVQQLVIESALLAAAGAGLGVAIAAGLMRALAAMAPEGTPFVETIALDARVLAVALVVTGVAVLLAGVMPALVTSGLRLTTALKDGTAGSGASARAVRMRHLLVVGEIAASVVLLVLGALLLRSFDRLVRVAPGVDVDRVLTGRISMPNARYPTGEKVGVFFDDLFGRLLANPDVASVAAATFVPAGTGGFGLGRVFLAEGRPEPPAGTDVDARWTVVTPGYFETVGIPLRQGRDFTADDRERMTPVAIVSESFVRKMFPNESPLGKRVRSWRDENLLREIVGVVGDVKTDGLADTEISGVYVPYRQDPWGSMLLVVRARQGDPSALAPAMRRAVAAADPLMALARVDTMASAARASIATQRYAALLVGVLATVALVLAALGTYAVIGYVFARRRREMGIRLALGASRTNVYALVFRYGLTLTGIGVAIGVAGAAVSSRWLATLLFDTRASDAVAWLSTIAAIVGAAALACLVPAHRSATADPVTALRTE